MKVRASWVVITGVFSLLLLIGWASRGQEKTPQKATWEYKLIAGGGVSPVDADRTEKMLNDLGAQGWELVSAQPYAEQFSINQGTQVTIQGNKSVTRYDYYFKHQTAK